jgi:prepilin-type N-terminal cleavage/methylation domain-containing protein
MNQRAFSLLELILVILILALVLGMAAPALRGFSTERDLSAAGQIAASACNYARSVAVTTGRRTRLGMDREKGKIYLLVEEDPLKEPGTFLPRRWPVGLTGTLPKGILIQQVYYPVVHMEEQEQESGPAERQSTREEAGEGKSQSEEEALEERKSVLLFEPDGSTRDTFIYLAAGNLSKETDLTSDEEAQKMDIVTVALVGSIGTTVIVPRYTEEIFEVYDTPGFP